MRDLPTFWYAYAYVAASRGWDVFLEWKAIQGQRAKQPYPIAPHGYVEEAASFLVQGADAVSLERWQ